MFSPIIVVSVGVICLIVGVVAGMWFSGQKHGKQAAKAEEVQSAFDDYKADVNTHFSNTAKHFAAIGQEYQALYNHMANGADALLGPDSEVRRAGFPFLPAAGDIDGESVTSEATADTNESVETGVDEQSESTPPESTPEDGADPTPAETPEAPTVADDQLSAPAEATETTDTETSLDAVADTDAVAETEDVADVAMATEHSSEDASDAQTTIEDLPEDAAETGTSHEQADDTPGEPDRK